MQGTKPGRSPSELFRYLSAKWPAAFNPKAPLPLKIGIHHDIRALDCELSDDELSTAMRAYTKIRNYLSKLRAGAVRVDLNGEPAGEVSEADAAAAKALMRAHNLKRRAAQTPAPKAEAESQSKPEPKRARTLETKITAGNVTGVVVETKRRRSFRSRSSGGWWHRLDAARQYPRCYRQIKIMLMEPEQGLPRTAKLEDTISLRQRK